MATGTKRFHAVNMWRKKMSPRQGIGEPIMLKGDWMEEMQKAMSTKSVLVIFFTIFFKFKRYYATLLLRHWNEKNGTLQF